MRSNAGFFGCERLRPNKEEKSEEAWEPVFSFGHFYQSVVERSVVCQTLFSSLGKLRQLKKNNRMLNQAFIVRIPL